MYRRKSHLKLRGRRLRMETLEDRRVLAALTVSTIADIEDGDTLNVATLLADKGPDGEISLREAIIATNGESGLDTIDFAQSLNGLTITLNEGITGPTPGKELTITDSLIIDASMLSSGLTIAGTGGMDGTVGNGDGTRIFNISSNVEIDGLTLTGGDPSGNGGAIRSFQNLTVRNSLITDNAAGNSGGGIYAVSDSLTIQSSTISGNRTNENLGSSGGGGGISFYGKDLRINSSTISGNIAGYSGGRYLYTTAQGGGIHATISDGSLTINGSTIEANEARAGYGGGAFVSVNNSTASISNTIITNNKAIADDDGLEGNTGGLDIRATNSVVDLDRVTIINNEADDDIGGLYLDNDGGTATISNSTISDNLAKINSLFDAGGGVWLRTQNGGGTTIDSSTISGNTSNARGGGIFLWGDTGTTTTIRNTTVSGNAATAESAGGIDIFNSGNSGGDVLIEHSTITNNSVSAGESGGGISVGAGFNSTLVTLSNTIVAGNYSGTVATPNNISGSVNIATSQYNLIGSGGSGGLANNNNGNKVGTAFDDPGLAPLANNGGPTKTHRPMEGSEAIDAGIMVFDPSGPDGILGNEDDIIYDQRGAAFSRVLEGRIDIGAVEISDAPRVLNVTISNSDPLSPHDPFSFATATVDVVNQSGQTLATNQPVTGSGNQLRSVPVGGADTVSITFSEDVNVVAGDLQLTALTTAAPRPLLVGWNLPPGYGYNSGFDYDSETRTATWEFESIVANDMYAISLESPDAGTTGVTDVDNGNALDGNWKNPANVFVSSDVGVSTFPSGDGIVGDPTQNDDFVFVFTLIAGDFNLNNVVEGYDFFWQLWPNYGTGTSFVNGDSDGDGDVDGDDIQNFFAGYYALIDLQNLSILADLDGDNDVDLDDIADLVNNIGMQNPTGADGDLDEDGDIDFDDLSLAFAQYLLDIDVVA